MILLIDNYDSFTYIVRHYFEENKIQYKIEEQTNMQVTVEQKINNKII